MGIEQARRRFPTLHDIPASSWDRIQAMKLAHRERYPHISESEQAKRERYTRMLSKENLPTARVNDLRDLARDRALGSVGNQQVFLAEWIRLGDDEASRRMRRALFYLLYGEGEAADRLNDLLGSDHPLSMTGLKEKILTKALCMAFPTGWIPVIGYSGESGKKEIIESLTGVFLPRQDATMTRGRLIKLSNDLLIQIVRPEFTDLEMAAGFLWEASAHLRAGKEAREYGIRTTPATLRKFVCSSCHLEKAAQQLADSQKELCRDCA
jgi:hypothetical protein